MTPMDARGHKGTPVGRQRTPIGLQSTPEDFRKKKSTLEMREKEAKK